MGTATEPDEKPSAGKDNRGDNIVDLPVKLEHKVLPDLQVLRVQALLVLPVKLAHKV